MILFSDVKIKECLYKSSNSIIYRGRDEAAGQSVIIKVLNREYPKPEALAHFKQECNYSPPNLFCQPKPSEWQSKG
jgi:hypothetical protein